MLVDTDQSVRQAGGYLVQLMPGVTDAQIDRLERNIAATGSVTSMLDEGLTLADITRRVLDGFDVELFDSVPVAYRCACGRGKVERALVSLGREELQKLADQPDNTEITCQFCDKVYYFTPAEIAALLAHAVK